MLVKVGAGVPLEELCEDVLEVVLVMLAELLGTEAGDAELLAPPVIAVALPDEVVVREPDDEPIEVEEGLTELVSEPPEVEAGPAELELAELPREPELAEPKREPEAVETPEDAGLVQAADAARRFWCPVPICTSVASHSCSYFWSSNHTRQIAFC